MSYEKYYPGGWQSGESGGTPITPEALNHIENGIKQTYSDFAPAGFGLGSADSKQLSTADDLNNCAENGFYSWALSPINAPFPNGMMIVATYDWARKIQYIWSAENGCAVQRIQCGASWGEPEWVNPPMLGGVEYRTTERLNGEPIYKILLSAGQLPNASNKYIAMPVSGLKEYLRIFLKTNDGKGNYRYIAGDGSGVKVYIAEGWKLMIVTDGDWSQTGGILEVHYTKN